MRKYIEQYKTGNTDGERVSAINQQLLEPAMPIVKKGVLYLDGEGTASAAVAKRGAELFNEGDYSAVVIAGGARPWFDLKAFKVFPKVCRDGLSLPRLFDTEAKYIARCFNKAADPKKLQILEKYKNFHVIEKGKNTGDKVEACKHIFNELGLVQAVTLAYTVSRLVGTIAKEVPNVDVTAQRVYPFGLNNNNWQDWYISYAIIMAEADKTGPRMDGQKPTYEDKYFTRVDLEEMGKAARSTEMRLPLHPF